MEGRLSSEKEFGKIIVKSNPADGSLVYLKDVARIELGKFNYSGRSYVDGKHASFLLVFQLPGSNAMETANGVYEEMDKLKKSFPSDIDYSVPV